MLLTRNAELEIGCAPVCNAAGEIIAWVPRVDDVTFADRFPTQDEALAAARAIASDD